MGVWCGDDYSKDDVTPSVTRNGDRRLRALFGVNYVEGCSAGAPFTSLNAASTVSPSQ